MQNILNYKKYCYTKYKIYNMNVKNLIKIFIICSFFLISCSDEKQNKSNYKKKTDIPLTGQLFDKENNHSNKVSDFY